MADTGETPKSVGFFGLFRFADKIDVLVMLAGTLCMLALAVAIPLNIYFFGDLITEYVAFDTPRQVQNLTTDTITWTKCSLDNIARYAAEDEDYNEELAMAEIVYKYSIAFSLNGIFGFIVAYLGITLWTWTGERQIRRVRTSYFEAVMRQSVGWFDVHNAGEINSRLTGDVTKLSDGFGRQMATFIQWIGSFIGCYVMSFISGWKLTLVAIVGGPLMVIVTTFLSRFTRTLATKEAQAHARAGAVAEETFSSIRTVAAFGGEKKAEEKYINRLQDALKEGVRKATVGGVNGGLYNLLMFGLFAICLWYGAKLTREECLGAGAIMQVFWGVLMGSLNLGYAIPVFDNFSNARAAAAALFQTIDVPVDIDSSSEKGLKPHKVDGNIEFVDVGFSYPSRKEAKVLKGLSLSANKGERIALVGESGCGKSTAVRLIQRFYDCDEGKILIDGEDLKDYNLTWLRNYMGIVSQEPVLFATTIGENIRLGSKCGDEITQEQIETAAKQANCYDFITKLPEGFDTLVGERGEQLSGGQKQRIAIARALVRNPAILLLDEATSALDTQSEAIVQDALDKASQGRTTIIIAHRLSTIRGTDKIIAVGDGKVCEEGTHDQLMSKESRYYTLVMRQLEKEREEDEERQREKEKEFRLQTLSALSGQGSHHSLSDTPHNGSKGSLNSPLPEEFEMEKVDVKKGLQETEQLLQSKDQKDEAEITKIEILAMNGPEWHLLTVGTFAAFVVGTIQLILALIMSEVVGKLSEPDPEIQQAEMARYTLYIVLTGIMAATFTPLQSACWALSGERMTMRLRKQTFAATVRQEIAYFDDKRNGVSFLTSRLSADVPKVKGATGIRIGVFTQCLTTTIGVLVISFAYVWELALATLVFIPIMLVAGKVQQTLSSGYAKQIKDGVEKGGKMAQEAISNMTTVTSLNRQRYFTDRFYRHFKQLYKADTKTIFSHGIEYGVAQSMLFVLHALCFGFGSYLVICDCLSWRTERIPFYYILRVFSVVTFGSMSVGRTIAQLPDYTTAKLAADNIKKLLDRKSTIDPTSSAGTKIATVEGTVQFTDVKFSYPTRETVQVLQGVSFTVKKGETLALVGSSGCGKSTSVSLLERFYDYNSGEVAIDGRDVKSLNIQWLRHNLGLVSQEPTLFDTSIAENIAYGDNTREVSMAEIIQVATKANAHNFITSLPDGYETNVGAKGTQLSGGQKQRIAIARALIRNPAVLLLDEATSALDAESEKVVQEALDEALVGRTAIIIAHRLSTIRNANNIGVIDNGKIVEFGTHEQLIEKKRFYFDLVNAQL